MKMLVFVVFCEEPRIWVIDTNKAAKYQFHPEFCSRIVY